MYACSVLNNSFVVQTPKMFSKRKKKTKRLDFSCGRYRVFSAACWFVFLIEAELSGRKVAIFVIIIAYACMAYFKAPQLGQHFGYMKTKATAQLLKQKESCGKKKKKVKINHVYEMCLEFKALISRHLHKF